MLGRYILLLFLTLNLGCSLDARLEQLRDGVIDSYDDLGYVIMPKEKIAVSGESDVSIKPVVFNARDFSVYPRLPAGLNVDRSTGEISGYINDSSFTAGRYALNFRTIQGSSGSVNFEISNLQIDDIDMSAYSAGVCILMSGEVTCWGVSREISLGYSGGVPQKIPNLNNVTQIAVAKGSGCAVTSDGQVKCWGAGNVGELGWGVPQSDSLSAVPIQVTGGGSPKFTKIAAGNTHYCAITEEKDIYCWGLNTSSQLGLGHSTPTNQASRSNFLAGKAEALALGDNFSCALSSDDEIWCWGSNGSRQLGSGTSVAKAEAAPVRVVKLGTSNPLTGIKSIHAGYVTACANTTSGLYCWGSNAHLQIDTTLGTSVNGGYLVDESTEVSSVDISSLHLCFVKSKLGFCSGRNAMGALGSGTLDPTPGKFPVAGGYHFSKIVAGGWINPQYSAASCALTETKKLMCWGSNYGNLVTPLRAHKAAPEKIADARGAISISKVGQLNNVICKIQNNKVFCAHTNDYEKAGISGNHWVGSWNQIGGLPTDYAPALVKTGPYSSCALLKKTGSPNQLWCWGYNGLGGRGDGTYVGGAVATKATLEGIADFELGTHSTCAKTEDNTLYCVGSNAQKQLGPDPVCRGLTKSADWCLVENDVVGFSHNGYQSCLLSKAGNIKCWGEYSPLLYSSDFITPAGIPAEEKLHKISVTSGQLCVAAESGGIYCRGRAVDSLVNRQLNTRLSPDSLEDFAKIDQVVGVKDIYSVGYGSYCVMLDNKKLLCRGDAKKLPLYHTSNVFYPELTEVYLPFSTQKIEMLYANTACLRSDLGDLYCWGAGVDLNLLKGGNDGSMISIPTYVEGI